MTVARDEATQAQVDAANPGVSTWLSANAGSGKTRVLTDRVARLLLEDVNPQQILCLTYTKAAAFEMQNRLFARLGAWAMLPNDALCSELETLGIEGQPSAEDLAKARTLFARAIETPGGLKIQTIHAFCASVLRRFPLEAQVSPDFTEIEDRAAELLRAEIVDQMADGPEANLVTEIAAIFTGAEFGALTGEIVRRSDWFQQHLDRKGLLQALGQPEDLDETRLLSIAFDGTEMQFIPQVCTVLSAASKTNAAVAEALSGIDWDRPGMDDLRTCIAAFLKKSGASYLPETKSTIPSKKPAEELGPLLAPFLDLMARVAQAHDAALALAALQQTEVLWRFAQGFLTRYETAKTARGWLDFDDLIRKTRDLLADNTKAQWVLYRLDGGIDHILVDEAQDTSPTQWDVIRSLTTEITSGEGAHSDKTRTIFVVGDKKQSIYSFQGADPRAFDDMQAHFAAQFGAADNRFFTRTLEFSFRSAAAILSLVDASFEGQSNAGFVSDQTHRAFKSALPGRVELWPAVEPSSEQDDEPWYQPLDRKSSAHHHVQLAEQIATRIEQMLDAENPALIPEDDRSGRVFLRPVRPGDIMILVQGRTSGPFAEVIRALKAKELPVAGADRLKVGAELAVRDILALLSFLDTPDDSLSLANTLKSPLFGWDEQSLFDLAHHRKSPQLWEALRQRRDVFPEAYEIIHDLRNLTDFLRPYDLIERILTRHSGRERLIGRLGPEAEDGIDALLSQALSYERTEVPSLTGFLSWARADALEIKRQMDSGGNLIRVMTVHGAKGLEAPIVILPDCAARRSQSRGNIVGVGGLPIWKPAGAAVPEAIRTEREERAEAEARERLRLLYVAMTRAEKWLIVAAAGKLDTAGRDWYSIVKSGLEAQGATPDGDGLRLEQGDWQGLPLEVPVTSAPIAVPLPPELRADPPPQPERPHIMSPSQLGGAKALPSELALDETTAMARGSYVHALIEMLLPADPARWTEIAETITPKNLPHDLITPARHEVLAILQDPALQWLHDENALREVTLSGTVHGITMRGVVDHLTVTANHIRLVDFKTNTAVPDRPETCPDGILRQMGAYAAILGQIYPDRQIEIGVLWTATRHYMLLPHDLVSAALAGAPDLDDAGLAP